jgi:fumarate reductase flavoprotein subunit
MLKSGYRYFFSSKKGDKMKKNVLSRRSFIKHAASGVAGITAMGLLSSCTPTVVEEPAAETAVASSKDFMANVPGWLGEKPAIDNVEYEENCEILVLGLGNSGVPAALHAVELGADVLAVEPQGKDTYDNYACDMSSYNSKTFLDAGAPEYDLMDVFNEYMRKTFGKANPSLVRQWVTRSGEAIDWLVSHVPQETKDQYMYLCNTPNGPKYFSGESVGSHNYIGMIQWRQVNPNANVWPQVIKPIIEQIEEKGGRIKWGSKGVVLVQNDAGDVTGCICQDAESKYFKVNASKGVLMACGDYGGNPDMLLDLTDEVRNLKWSIGQDRSVPENMFGMGRDGSGHRMGMWAGGTMEGGPRAPMSISLAGRPGFPFGGCWPVFGPDGKRFYNEALTKFGGQGVFNNLPDGTLCATICDANWREGLEYQDYGHSSMDLNNEYYIGVIEDEMAAYKTGAEGFPVHNFMVYGDATSTIYAAETLEELGTILGYEGDALQGFLDEIAHYNEMCEAKYDSDWGYDPQLMFGIKDAPFFGVSSKIALGTVSAGLVQLAGLNTDGNQQVLNAKKLPIKGLFATGNVCGNRYAVQYHTPTSGNSCGTAITMGYIAGEYMATKL